MVCLLHRFETRCADAEAGEHDENHSHPHEEDRAIQESGELLLREGAISERRYSRRVGAS